MAESRQTPPETTRGTVSLVELLGAVSLATDLGTGEPQFHGVRTSVLAVAVARELGLDPPGLHVVQQVALLVVHFRGRQALRRSWMSNRLTLLNLGELLLVEGDLTRPVVQRGKQLFGQVVGLR